MRRLHAVAMLVTMLVDELDGVLAALVPCACTVCEDENAGAAMGGRGERRAGTTSEMDAACATYDAD